MGEGPLIVGLTTDPKRLVQVRRNRLRSLDHNDDTDYVDPEIVRDEVATADACLVIANGR